MLKKTEYPYLFHDCPFLYIDCEHLILQPSYEDLRGPFRGITHAAEIFHFVMAI